MEDISGTFFDNFLDISSAGKASQVDLRKVQKSRKMTEIRQDQHFDKGGDGIQAQVRDRSILPRPCSMDDLFWDGSIVLFSGSLGPCEV